METIAIFIILFIILIIQFRLYKKIQQEKTVLAPRSHKESIYDSQQQKKNSTLIIHDDKNEEIKFELVKDIDISKYRSVPMDIHNKNDVQNFISSLLGGGANIGIASQATRGLFKATASPDKLMQLSTGGYGSAIMKNGKIVGQAGFVKAGSTLFTPLIAFQITSHREILKQLL